PRSRSALGTLCMSLRLTADIHRLHAGTLPVHVMRGTPISVAARGGRVALVVLVATTAAAVPLGAVSHSPVQLPLLAVALVAFAVVLGDHRRTPFLTRKVVVVASGVLMLV